MKRQFDQYFNSSILFKKYERTSLDYKVENNKCLQFQQTEINYFIDIFSNYEPVLRIFGITDDEKSVCVLVKNFKPYFFIKVEKEECIDLNLFEHQLKEKSRYQLKGIELVEGKSIYYYDESQQYSNFLKITYDSPLNTRIIIKICEEYFCSHFGFNNHLQIFESKIDFVIRFMVDLDIVGCNWIELPAGKHFESNRDLTHCQIERTIDYRDVISHQPDGYWSKVGPFRILSFDIECAGRKGIFPEPDLDPVIQIANVVTTRGSDIKKKIIFALDSCAPIEDVDLYTFESEEQLLASWSIFVNKYDPDIITGYNIQNFDFPYLIDRAKALNIYSFPLLGRVRHENTIYRSKMISSKQLGSRENKDINISGRTLLDLLLIILRDYKLRSFTLNSVSEHFLNEKKEDVHHSIITDLQNGDQFTRQRLARYCLKDALLPLRLMDKLMSLINYMEMARVTGVPFNFLLSRGQQIKVMSQLLRQTKKKKYFIPTLQTVENPEPYEGALVIEPKKGFYDEPIATLDFASLYPSIMMCHNLCYTTIISNTQLARGNIDKNDFETTPAKFHFIKSSKQRGLLPEILENLLKARKRAKDDLKKEIDPFKRKVLDGRQLALKVSANSVYGFTGAQLGVLPCLGISQSVTAYGREMIELTKNVVLERYRKENGYPADSNVIYGDTDSVMVSFGVKTVAEAMKLGAEAAEFVSQRFVSPIKLEFEKVYFPYLLINKKRYAGLYYTKPDMFDKMDCKGLESVRRDNCLLVSNMVSVCLQKILIDRDPKGAIEYTKGKISDLLTNKIDMQELIISKELTKVVYKSNAPHSELAIKMSKRDAGSAPKLGDRVQYVIIEGDKKDKIYMKSEDPMYVLEHNLQIDFDYYLKNQLSKPLVKIFDPILKGKAEEILLKGDHTRTISKKISKTSALSCFYKPVNRCLVCKVPLKSFDNVSKITCMNDECLSKENKLKEREIKEMNILQSRFDDLWSQCITCQGTKEAADSCSSKDCAIFYKRYKAGKDRQEQVELMQRFDF